ncbi:MAG: bifunctional enoyl-CoA hydratase/phosphate acetyltransferase [Spirochaetes bacterium]|nr:bifunctional enoyl-CoA hydratase/phosphate acetyltransferase [Spirochaetota bacterium]
MKRLADLLEKTQEKKVKAVIAGSNDEHVLDAIKQATLKNYIVPVFIGNKEETISIAKQIDFDISSYELIDESEENKIAELAIKKVCAEGKSILVKGLINTGIILKYVLDKQYGLNIGNTLSHVAIMEIPGFEKLYFITDAALNIDPTLEQKIDIVKNAVKVANSIGIENPKVALIGANEKVSLKMKATTDAAIITKMAERGEIKNCIIDGPLALDIAISLEALKIKKVSSPINGDADILVVPDIDAGNVLYKSIIYFAKAETAGIICGAKIPVVVTSRSDSALSKLYSIVLATYYQ